MRKFEYYTLNIFENIISGKNTELNNLGNDGWELVLSTAYKGVLSLYFKREVKQTLCGNVRFHIREFCV